MLKVCPVVPTTPRYTASLDTRGKYDMHLADCQQHGTATQSIDEQEYKYHKEEVISMCLEYSSTCCKMFSDTARRGRNLSSVTMTSTGLGKLCSYSFSINGQIACSRRKWQYGYKIVGHGWYRFTPATWRICSVSFETREIFCNIRHHHLTTL